MSGHLSSREISEWTAGIRTLQSEDHLHRCAECRAELARLHESLSDFRDSLRDWSASQGTAPRPVWLTEAPRSAHRVRWALVAVAMIVLAAIPFYRSHNRQRPTDTGMDDAVLLEQIDTDVSRSVPASMEPLTNLVSWNATDVSANGAKLQRQKK